MFPLLCAFILIVIKTVDARKQCAEFKWNGQAIPATSECQEVQVRCPRNLEGTATFSCQCEKAEWTEKPDLSRCLSKTISSLVSSTGQGEPLTLMRRFNDEITRLVDNGQITSGDIVAFIDSVDNHLLPKSLQKLADPNRRPEWCEEFGREVSKSIGGTGDQLLRDASKQAWMDLNEDKRIDTASRLMILLQNSLVVLGAGKEAGQNASVRFQNYEGHIQLAQPAIQHSPPMMVSKVMRFGNVVSEPEPPSENVEFRNGRMQLPNINLLSTLAPSGNSPNIFMTSRFVITDDNQGPNFEPQSVKIGYFTFSKLGQLMTNSTARTRLNSDIMGAFVNDPTISVSLSQTPVNFTFEHLQTEGVESPRCVYWDILQSQWSTRGCALRATNKTHTQCLCNHLTSFAVLVDLSDSLALYEGRAGNTRRWHADVLDWMTKIGCTISILCLILCILVFTLFRSLYNTRTMIHRNLCLCLLIGELLFLFGIDYTQDSTICHGISIGLHYIFLCAFSWMLVEGYQLYLMLVKVFEATRTRIVYYYMIGYLLPALTVATSFTLAPENYGTPDYCWINVRTFTLWTFLGPVAAILVFNTVVLIIALRTVLSVRNRDRSLADRVLGKKFIHVDSAI